MIVAKARGSSGTSLRDLRNEQSMSAKQESLKPRRFSAYAKELSDRVMYGAMSLNGVYHIAQHNVTAVREIGGGSSLCYDRQSATFEAILTPTVILMGSQSIRSK